MKKIIVEIIFFFSSFVAFSQQNFDNTSDITNPYCFGGRIYVTGHGIGQFYLIKVNAKNQITYVEVLPTDQFLREAMGKEQSLANPKKINLFAKYGIDDPNIIYSLWKLRYAEYPYKTNDSTQGWTNNFKNPFMPFPSQMKILKQYGLNNINDYIYGDNLFKLLKDMENPQWVAKYIEAGKDTEQPKNE